MVARALGARQHGGVIGHDDGARALLAELRAVDGAHARDHAVGRRVGDQVVHAASARLRGNGQRAVLDEAALIAKIGDVLARAAAALGMAFGHGLGPGGVQREGMAVDDAAQVGADVVRVLGDLLRACVGLHAFGGGQHQQGLVLGHIGTGLGQQLGDGAGLRRQQHMLHLHGFEHAQLGACSHGIAHGHAPLHDARGHGGRDGALGDGRASSLGRRRNLGGHSRAARAFGQRLGVRHQFGKGLFKPACVHGLRCHLGPAGQRLQQRQIGGQPVDAAFVQCAACAAQHVFEARPAAVHDELGQQRVVVRRGAGARHRMRVDADAGAGRPLQCAYAPAAGARLACGIQRLGIDAPLHGIAARRGGGPGIQAQLAQVIARRNADLGLHQVDAEDFLGDGVLDLQARVGLDEHIGQGVGGGIDQEFEGAQALVADLGGHAQRVARDALAQRLRQAGAGRDLDQLLEAPLQRAFALAQRDGACAAIAQDLHLDMARARHQTLHIDTVHAEGGARLAAAALVGSGQVLGTRHGAHAAPAAAADGLDHDAAGAPGLLRLEEGLGLFQRDGLAAAQHQRHAAAACQIACAGLVAQQRQVLRRGTDEAQSRIGTGLGKAGVLAEKAVARMDAVAAVLARNAQQVGAVQVGRGAAGVQGHGCIGSGYMGRLRIVCGKDGQARHTQLAQRAHDAQRDLAAVGYQDLLEHGTSVFLIDRAASDAAPCLRRWQAAPR